MTTFVCMRGLLSPSARSGVRVLLDHTEMRKCWLILLQLIGK